MGDYVDVSVVAHETQKRMPCLWLEIQTAVNRLLRGLGTEFSSSARAIPALNSKTLTREMPQNLGRFALSFIRSSHLYPSTSCEEFCMNVSRDCSQKQKHHFRFLFQYII